jgi:4a-hydroxytetrahydrobiopterin dehydratase
MDTLTDREIDEALADLEGWERDGDAITRSYTFDGFMDAIAFIDRLAPEAEAANHHPEIRNVYATVDIRLTTHDAGGITRKDLDLARRIDAVR